MAVKGVDVYVLTVIMSDGIDVCSAVDVMIIRCSMSMVVVMYAERQLNWK